MTDNVSIDGSDLILLPVLAGPTAAGKTAAGVAVAEAIGGEIVSADSRQIYRGMEIGSGAPSSQEMKKVKHHFIATIDPHFRISAGEFARIARETIKEIRRRNKVPVIVGGSGLYIRALIDRLVELPEPDRDLREEIERQIEELGMLAMIEELRVVDPEYAQKVGINDRKRLVRAMEVWQSTGKPFSAWHDGQSEEKWCHPLMFGIDRPRSELHELIARRIDQMLEDGWIDEVNSLVTHYGDFEKLPPAVSEAVGYSELVAYLRNEISLSDAKERILISTRQFAKRQMTWFRADKRIEWYECSGKQAAFRWSESIIETLRKTIN